ncbi:hypothetical protein EIN_183350 [Entamoeba invadens IP1]|uniref:hypothetical protein n=1 Tax=Entamoeba invadens IP1 TaxID=370355 RepID=UPI0002C3E09B|nr:hypothetical protein EIN_183350 [Entamoeba invadens IP1]ELP94058.1 hypothetical protein EIN_183350 [Entamoeba invadens IP1]|eukprot:XP_004260829.1 hypothetical protein EIN_183350 [Entamoeba invadens IP1]
MTVQCKCGRLIHSAPLYQQPQQQIDENIYETQQKIDAKGISNNTHDIQEGGGYCPPSVPLQEQKNYPSLPIAENKFEFNNFVFLDSQPYQVDTTESDQHVNNENDVLEKATETKKTLQTNEKKAKSEKVKKLEAEKLKNEQKKAQLLKEKKELLDAKELLKESDDFEKATFESQIDENVLHIFKKYKVKISPILPVALVNQIDVNLVTNEKMANLVMDSLVSNFVSQL